MKQHHKLGNNALNAVGDKHLIAIELDAVLANVEIVLDFWEIEDSGESEWEVYVQMNPEQRIVLCWLDCMVELDVILILEVGGLARPQRLNIVDYLVLVGIDILAILPLLLLSKNNWNGHEFAVLVEQSVDA